ncbi:FAD-binding oxidoreductase [Streptomyces sp. AJS327]|uniref:NAD(P)/FAD-dependent oxidoreductase n=1 Tax=Streptomyces sp. AJS327 TaxID=2545265 RepID=UPI0015DDD6D0|nr:FAD-binding oxidoreductase [Streptomyces sp. AJS327]MBA0050174.1 FAD-binding oxidoreductase [Streptomyces sp. AJS327]
MNGSHADGRIVIVGGGVVGTSLAFHLTQLGHREVVLIERGELGEGTTAYGTGGIRQQFTSRVNAQLVRRSVDFFSEFTERTGEPFDFRQHGYLFLLDDENTAAAFATAVRTQNELGVPSRLLTPEEVPALAPGVRLDGLVGAAYCPTDGSASPTDATAGFARAARRRGADIRRNTEVTGFLRDADGTVTGVRTTTEDVTASTVVIATGPQARALGRLAGIELPVAPHRRQAFAIAPLPWIDAAQPLTVDVGSGAYVHPEHGGSAVVGGNDRETPEGTDTSIDESRVEPLLEALVHRWPGMTEAAVVRGWAGLREMTPDDHALVGASEVPGLWAAVGFSGHGFMQAPAVGEALAELLLTGGSQLDLAPLRLSRFAEGRPVDEGVRF